MQDDSDQNAPRYGQHRPLHWLWTSGLLIPPGLFSAFAVLIGFPPNIIVLAFLIGALFSAVLAVAFWRSGLSGNGRSNIESDFHPLCHNILSHIHEAVLITHTDYSIEYANPAFYSMTGYTSADDIDHLFSLFARNKDQTCKAISRLLKVRGTYSGEVVGHRQDGSALPMKIRIIEARNESDDVEHLIVLLNDLSRFKQVQSEVAFLSSYDPLTRLPNRTLFLQRLENNIREAAAVSLEYALLICNLREFRVVNENLGHDRGDMILQKVADRLQTTIDRVHYLSRLGSDEFAVLISDEEVLPVAENTAQAIISAFQMPFILDHHEISLAVCIGICRFPHDGQDVQTLLQNTNFATFQANQNGKDRYLVFDSVMQDKARRRRQLEADLKEAIAEEKIDVYFQPKVNLDTYEIAGAEALARWNHPELGRISPEIFIAIAEETGMIDKLGEMVLKKACTSAHHWHEHGHRHVKIAVNLSAYQFNTSDLAERVADTLWETSLAPHSLELELTETIVMKNADKSRMVMRVLKSMGICLCIDDFGTGYSSLNYLREFPLDCVKIDQSFIRDMISDSQDAIIVNAVIAMAKHLKMKLVAEGVETLQQLEALKRQECDEIQGFLVSPALPDKEFMIFLEQHRQKLIKEGRESFFSHLRTVSKPEAGQSSA